VFAVLGIQYAMRTRGIVIYGVSPLPYSFTLSHERHDIRKNKLLNINTCFDFSLQPASQTFFIPKRNESDIIINVYRSACELPMIVVRFK
jgi:GTP:adenosylcobinamide-phosphate guanylyltransferase